jgi:hypothetical protein
MEKKQILKLGSTVHMEAHPNKINLILDGKPHIIKVDDPFYLDLLLMSIIRSTILMREDIKKAPNDGGS